MATKRKTVTYAFPMLTTDMADATLSTVGTITVDIPETSGRVFRSVFAELSYMDNQTATGSTITESRLALAIDAVGDSTVSELDDLTNTGENMSGVLQIDDFTSYFTTNFTTGSHSVTAKAYIDVSTGTTLTTRNIAVLLHITYDYDDTAATQVKTVCIPLESGTGTLQTTETEIGTNQIPDLSAFIGEASPTIKDWFIVAEGNSANAGTTDSQLNFRVDTDTTFQPGLIENALSSSCWHRFIFKPTAPASNAAHAFKCWNSISSQFGSMSFKLYVTYTFDASSSTVVTNSLQIPFHLDGSRNQSTELSGSEITLEVIVPEPTTITMLQSAVAIYQSQGASVTTQIKVGSQGSYRGYVNAAAAVCGQHNFMHRIDSGGASGSAITLARGRNLINIRVYASAGTPGSYSGILYLNYKSGKASAGIGAHNNTTRYLVRAIDRTGQTNTNSPAWAPPSESKYYLNSVGFQLAYWIAPAANYAELGVQASSGTQMKKVMGGNACISDPEIGYYDAFIDGTKVYKRHPNDPDTSKLDLFGSNQAINLNSSAAIQFGVIGFVTQHAVYSADTGTVSDYGGSGSGIPVNIFRDDTGELVRSITSGSGGSLAFDNYWGGVNLFASAREDSTHVGRSERAAS